MEHFTFAHSLVAGTQALWPCLCGKEPGKLELAVNTDRRGNSLGM